MSTGDPRHLLRFSWNASLSQRTVKLEQPTTPFGILAALLIPTTFLEIAIGKSFFYNISLISISALVSYQATHEKIWILKKQSTINFSYNLYIYIYIFFFINAFATQKFSSF